jgi:hypothetical protein
MKPTLAPNNNRMPELIARLRQNALLSLALAFAHLPQPAVLPHGEQWQ